jgi:chromosome partitioning protein
MGRIIAIANRKGGVAKSTTAINLGRTLAKKGKRVCLIDLDSQGDLTTLTYPTEEFPEGMEERLRTGAIEPGITNSYILFHGDVMPEPDTVTMACGKTIDIIPTTSQLARIEQEDLSCIHNFRSKVRKLSEGYDYIIIDTPPAAGTLQTSALAAAYHVLLPVQLEALSIKNGKELIKLVAGLKQVANPELELLGILMTLTDKQKTNIMKVFSDRLIRDYGDLVLKTEITRSTHIVTASALGLSIAEHMPKAQQAEQYESLTDEIEARIDSRMSHQVEHEVVI